MIKRHDSIVVQKISRILIPFILVFAIYVLTHGHYSPGGGFQAGVLIGASIIMELLVGTKRELQRFSIVREFALSALGVGVFLSMGAFALLGGQDFFNYEGLSFLSNDPAMRRYWAILIAEIGITITVAMTLVVIFLVLAFLKKEPTE